MDQTNFPANTVIECVNCAADIHAIMNQADDAQVFYEGTCVVCKLNLSLCVEDQKEES